MYILLYIYIRYIQRVSGGFFTIFRPDPRRGTLLKPRTNFANLAVGTDHYLISLLQTFRLLYSFGFLFFDSTSHNFFEFKIR